MKMKTIAGAAMLSVLVASFTTLAFVQPAFAFPSSQKERAFAERSTQVRGHDRDHDLTRINLTLGQTITLTGLAARYVDADNKTIRGNASASFTFTVTGVFRAGYTLSLSSGTFKIGDTSYTVSGGSVTLGRYGREIVGSGSAGQGVSFLIRAGFLPNATGATKSRVMLDVKNGSAEYLVGLRTPKS